MSATFAVTASAGDTIIIAAANVSGLDRAKRFVEEELARVGILVNATDWRKDSEGRWSVVRADSTARVLPARAFVPRPRPESDRWEGR